MRLRTLIELLAAIVLTFAALLAISQMVKASGIEVHDPYARASIGAVTTGAVYLKLANQQAEADRLRAVSTDIAARAELHVHAMTDDVMSMQDISCLTVPAGAVIDFAPGGLHVMLSGLSQPLRQGDRFSLRLTFDRAGQIAVNVTVKSAAEGALAPHHPPKLDICD